MPSISSPSSLPSTRDDLCIWALVSCVTGSGERCWCARVGAIKLRRDSRVAWSVPQLATKLRLWWKSPVLWSDWMADLGVYFRSTWTRITGLPFDQFICAFKLLLNLAVYTMQDISERIFVFVDNGGNEGQLGNLGPAGYGTMILGAQQHLHRQTTA